MALCTFLYIAVFVLKNKYVFNCLLNVSVDEACRIERVILFHSVGGSYREGSVPQQCPGHRHTKQNKVWGWSDTCPRCLLSFFHLWYRFCLHFPISPFPLPSQSHEIFIIDSHLSCRQSKATWRHIGIFVWELLLCLLDNKLTELPGIARGKNGRHTYVTNWDPHLHEQMLKRSKSTDHLNGPTR